MRSRGSFGLLLRQLVANRGFVARRVLREASALALTQLAPLLPAAAAAASRLDPNAAEPERFLACRAERRGDARAAALHRERAERRARNTAEISILEALRNTLAWRRWGASAGGAAEPVSTALEAGRLEEAGAHALDASGSPGSRVDGQLLVARAALEAGQEKLAGKLLERACALDPGRPDVWRELGRLALSEGCRSEAITALERAAALDPWDAEALAALGDALAEAEPARAREAWWRALALRPEDDAILLRLERCQERPQAGAGGEAELAMGSAPAALEVGESWETEVRVRCGAEGGALYVLEPFGSGVRCEPAGRVALAAGMSRLPLCLRAARPDAVNGGRPWPVRLALCAGGRVYRAQLSFAVPDPRPGRVFYVITEDHEVYDEREVTELAVVRRTLVDKSRLAERIANEQGARWTHMVDVASLGLVEWAAARSKGDKWRALRDDCREHLSDAVERGNDLGLHIHAFHDPASDVFAHGFDAESDRVTTQAALLEASIPRRGFWSRAFPALGDPSAVGSRAWATYRGIGRLEELGRLADPGFGVTLFRAGSLDYGEDAAERGRSTALLRRLGILADSDVPKPRFYHRLVSPTPYPVSEDIRRPAREPEAMRLLELRAEFNIESDFLSDVHVLNRYVDLRMEELRGLEGKLAPGVHIICCMTHDKFINWRMGREWDSLDPDYGDWATIRGHLRHVAAHHPQVELARPRDAILTWYDHYSPELLAWRDEEIVELAPPERNAELFRYRLRLLGRGIEVSAEHPQRVRVAPPAWLFGRVRECWIEREGERRPARALPAEPHPLEFDVDDRGAEWQLVVRAEPGDGITARARGGGLELRSQHGYRKATLEIPPALAPDGMRRRVRGVRLEQRDEAWAAFLPPEAIDAGDARG